MSVLSECSDCLAWNFRGSHRNRSETRLNWNGTLLKRNRSPQPHTEAQWKSSLAIGDTPVPSKCIVRSLSVRVIKLQVMFVDNIVELGILADATHSLV